MRTLRTPAERFGALPDFPYESRHADLPDQDGGMLAPLFAQLIPGARARNHTTLEGAGHFLQEDAGERFGREIASFVREAA